jgi:hypothetical protein
MWEYVLGRTYVNPRCDDTTLSKERASSEIFWEGVGVRHSCSKSCGASQPGKPSGRGSYLDVHVLSLDSVAKEKHVLHQGGKLGHVPDALQKWRLGIARRRTSRRHLLMASLPGRHEGDGWARPDLAPRREKSREMTWWLTEEKSHGHGEGSGHVNN